MPKFFKVGEEVYYQPETTKKDPTRLYRGMIVRISYDIIGRATIEVSSRHAQNGSKYYIHKLPVSRVYKIAEIERRAK